MSYIIFLPIILQDNQVLVVGSQDSFDFSVNKKNGDEGVYIRRCSKLVPKCDIFPAKYKQEYRIFMNIQSSESSYERFWERCSKIAIEWIYYAASKVLRIKDIKSTFQSKKYLLLLLSLHSNIIRNIYILLFHSSMIVHYSENIHDSGLHILVAFWIRCF